MSLLESGTWQGKIFSNGWVTTSGGEYPVIEPATGEELGTLGAATPQDVEAAGQKAAHAQKAWAATGIEERARVLRKAGELWGQHSEEVTGWIIRETGYIPPKAGFEIHMAESECFEASALPSHPYGKLIPSTAPRLSFSRRIPNRRGRCQYRSVHRIAVGHASNRRCTLPVLINSGSAP